MRCKNSQWWVTFPLVFTVVITIGLALNFGEASAYDYYVAAGNGNDSNPGTLQSPFLTLGKGLSVLFPGDTLYIREGTYLGSSSMFSIPSGKSWAEPVTLKAYQNENVILTAEPDKTVLQFKRESQYIIVDGITIDAKDGWHGVQTGIGSHHIRIMNSEIKNAKHQGFLSVEGSAYFELINLRIHDNGTNDFAHGVYINTSNHLVKDCEIYRNAGWGVHIYSGYSFKPNNNLIVNNKVYDNARTGSRGSGIGIYSGNGNKAINNIIWGNKSGVTTNWGASNTKIFNNTIYGNLMDGINVGEQSWDTQIINNISYKNSQQNIRDLGKYTILNHNIMTNPLFLDADNLDFQLQSDSPAINVGMVLTEVKYDFTGKLRPTNTNYDLGAYHRGESLLASPHGLRVLRP